MFLAPLLLILDSTRDVLDELLATIAPPDQLRAAMTAYSPTEDEIVGDTPGSDPFWFGGFSIWSCGEGMA